LALFSVGLQLKFNGWKKLIPQMSVSMFYKLILAPAITLGLALLLGIKGNIARITIFESAMPTVVTSSIIAEQFRLNTKLTNLTIGFSIIAAFTSAVWFYIIDIFLVDNATIVFSVKLYKKISSNLAKTYAEFQLKSILIRNLYID
jgi:predicted permease